MAESGGQKTIRNTLLSGATGANFFEEAAMLIPVPIVEPQLQPVEPAIAEIDLNSDDSSSNRGSVEKEFTDMLTFQEKYGADNAAEETEPTAPISLFSRAATSGVDVFSRMLASPAKSESSANKEIQSGPAIVQLTSPTLTTPMSGTISGGTSQDTAKPSSSSVSGLPSANLFSQQPASGSSFSSKVPDEGQIPPASSIFSSGTTSTSSFFSPVGTDLFSTTPAVTTFQAVPSVTTFQAVPSVTPSASPAFTLVSSSNNSQNPAMHPNFSSHQRKSPVQVSAPDPAVNSTMQVVPPPVIPGTLPTSIVSPPSAVSAGSGSNAFRLGSQRMKYVPCPEMQSVPTPSVAQAPLYQHSDVMPPANLPPAMQPPYTPASSMGSSIPSPPFQTTPSPVVSSFYSGEHSGSASSLSSRTSQVGGSANSYYPTTVGVSPYGGPQELLPLTYHWFFKKDVDGKSIWKPFSIIDSVALEDAVANDPERLVPTDGGRYDVCVKKRLKNPVYWDEAPIDVRRGSWFFKGPMDNRFIPYDEEFALKLEHAYADCMRTGGWQKRLEFPDGESVIMHSAGVVVHFCQAAAPDDWGNLPESQIRPRVVKRGVEEIEVEDGESAQIDHLVFVVHGIGPICDFKLRNIVEAVDDFRGLSFQLLHSHFRESIEKNLAGRIEFLPVSWHKSLHGDRGIDEQLKRITLRSIPKFRDFTNDTLLDILFYTSPVYCQTITDSVGSELNRIYKLFLTRNPNFKGNVSLTGHSLGSLILFDLLAHQPPRNDSVGTAAAGSASVIEEKQTNLESLNTSQSDDAVSGSGSRTVSYTVGTAGTGQPFITYPTIDFNPTAFFALGSPIAMFVTIRGIEKLANDFRLPTCPAFFNIFHPYDPVAYRIETLIDPSFQARPVLIPHHKGRKRIHLELKETMARVGADIKHKVIDAVKNTLNTVYHYTGFTNRPQENLENEIQSAIVGEMQNKSEADGAENENVHIRIGNLNGGRRVDYVLQEAPYETFNEYVFAMSTHVGYWESEDTMLLIMTEVYGSMGIQKDRQIAGSQPVTSPVQPQPTPMTVSQAISASGYFPSMNYGGGDGDGNQYAAGLQPSAPPAPLAEYHPVSQTPPSSLGYYRSGSPSGSSAAQTIPMIMPTVHSTGVLLPPSPTSTFSTATGPAPAKPYVIGNRPVVDPTACPRGMDPTAPPMINTSSVGPPPKAGFVPKQN